MSLKDGKDPHNGKTTQNMKRLKWRIILTLLGIGLGIAIGQAVRALLESTNGLVLARDIVGAVYGTPVLIGWLGYCLGNAFDDET